MATIRVSHIFEQLPERAQRRSVLRCRQRDFGADELAARRDLIARELALLGVAPGDRVAIILPKSVDVVAAMAAVLQLRAIYVPIDRYAPVARIRAILQDCGCRIAVTSAAFLRASELDLGAAIVLDHEASNEQEGRSSWSRFTSEGGAQSQRPREAIRGDGVAFILYTSGSTGLPKGVQITHRNLLTFSDWCVAELALSSADVMANHASFTFDISTMIYAALSVGACSVIYTEDEMRNPAALAASMEHDAVTVWYSVPSILQMMLATGVLGSRALPELRIVAFAGEVFPKKYVRELASALPGAALYNLYGPTETNVCTYHRVRPSDLAQETDLPIGKLLPGLRSWIVDEHGMELGEDAQGELVIGGPCVTPGYWNAKPHRNSEYHRQQRHATGDLVVQGDDGYIYRGRIDNMVKLHGYRVELGEIENVLCRREDIAEAAVVLAASGERPELVACIAGRASRPTPGLMEIKRFCAQVLPPYMIPHRVRAFDALPKNPNGKIDRRALASMLESAPGPLPSEARHDG